MPVQAVEQGTCESCGANENNYTFEDRTLAENGPMVSHTIRCECGEQALVQIGTTGICKAENVSHEDASWNQTADES